MTSDHAVKATPRQNIMLVIQVMLVIAWLMIMALAFTNHIGHHPGKVYDPNGSWVVWRCTLKPLNIHPLPYCVMHNQGAVG